MRGRGLGVVSEPQLRCSVGTERARRTDVKGHRMKSAVAETCRSVKASNSVIKMPYRQPCKSAPWPHVSYYTIRDSVLRLCSACCLSNSRRPGVSCIHIGVSSSVSIETRVRGAQPRDRGSILATGGSSVLLLVHTEQLAVSIFVLMLLYVGMGCKGLT